MILNSKDIAPDTIYYETGEVFGYFWVSHMTYCAMYRLLWQTCVYIRKIFIEVVQKRGCDPIQAQPGGLCFNDAQKRIRNPTQDDFWPPLSRSFHDLSFDCERDDDAHRAQMFL